MPSPDEAAPAPLYLELAPAPGAPAPVDHIFVFRDCGLLSGRGTGRFATDLFTLSLTLRARAENGPRPRLNLAPPRPAFCPRRAPFRGVIAGLRRGVAPDRLPSEEILDALTPALLAVAGNAGAVAPLVAALDRLACDLTFSGSHSAPVSARSKRRGIRAATGMSRRRLAAARRFRHLLDGLAACEQPLIDLALEAGYYVGRLPRLRRRLPGRAPPPGRRAALWPFLPRSRARHPPKTGHQSLTRRRPAMPDFEPKNADYDSRVRDSFNRQKVMHKLGISIGQLAPGRIVLEMNHDDDLTQQHGFLHAGIVSTALDSACATPPSRSCPPRPLC